MLESIPVGLTGTNTYPVAEENSAAAMGSGDLPVLATPALVAFMEHTAKESLLPYLPADATTVGTRISLAHLAPTPVGGSVRVESSLTEVRGKRLFFTLRAFDGAGLIGEGEHERCLVFSAPFLTRAAQRAESGD